MKYDVVIIGGGHSGLEKGMEALRAGKSCCALCKGVSSRKFRDESYRHEAAREEFRSLGGELLMGETVTGGVISDGLLMSVHTESHPDTPIEASVFYLSTGSFFMVKCGIWYDLYGIISYCVCVDKAYRYIPSTL